ncbi:MAG: hypothetical protein K2N47_02775 [Clostridia bacterium]|nr:hypothetical protein [Clostridia bacterium]
MSKAKSIVITVILAVAVAVATLFAAISFPYKNGRMDSMASRIHLGADFTGYAYTTVYPKDVITESEYLGKVAAYKEEKEHDKDEENPSEAYALYGSHYVLKKTYEEKYKTSEFIEKLKADVKEDAAKLNARFGKKGYSSYSVAVEDGLSIKISVPTNLNYASYKYPENIPQSGEDDRSNDLNNALYTIKYMVAYGNLTLRTAQSDNINFESGGSYKPVKDEWTDTALDGDGNKTYLLTGSDDASEYFKSVTFRTVGTVSYLTLNFTDEGAEKFSKVTTRAASSSSKTINFFLGDNLLAPFTDIGETFTGKSYTVTVNALVGEAVAIALNSAVTGGALTLSYEEVSSVIPSAAAWGDLAAILTLVACVLVFAGLAALLIVKYKKLGAVTAFVALILGLIMLYALFMLEIQVTFAVIFACLLCLALFVISCSAVYEEVRRLTAGGRTLQASVKDAYKKVLSTVIDLHVVLVVVAILLTLVGVGEVAACGFISLVGIIASFVLYWFMRFMWYVTSSLDKDKFKFAGIKRVVYEDD